MRTLRKIGLGLSICTTLSGLGFYTFNILQHNPYRDNYEVLNVLNATTTALNLEKLDNLFPYQSPKLRAILEEAKSKEVLIEFRDKSIEMMKQKEVTNYIEY